MRLCLRAVALAAVALIAGCSDVRPLPIKLPEASVPRYVRVKPAGKGPAVRVALEDYVRAAILSEFAPPSGDPGDIERMLEVQAGVIFFAFFAGIMAWTSASTGERSSRP